MISASAVPPPYHAGEAEAGAGVTPTQAKLSGHCPLGSELGGQSQG